ncbi:MAG: N-acetylmuramoyl-L-alanine amidase, partial [Syntrophales bacterium LBB04]|nr:N-acetylmuramoyl-L-alanine amidase [Syntrophales bacterium LBB04]
VEKEQSRAREKIKVVKKDKIIVIDPGHGGEDPGALGRRGTKEKDVVLAIGKKLKEVLNNSDGTRAFLTREGDYYVPFKKRLSIARELGADLFISVHADAAKNRSATGSSVYCLSIGGASSEAAKILAREENLADIIGGSFDDENSNDESHPIILDMFQTNTINRSRIFGAKILSSLCLINDIKFSHVQSAPFRVLKLPEIPAVLIETAYISNAREEKNLKDEEFQKKIARRVAKSVRDFFSLPEAASPAQAKADEKTKEKDKKDDGKTGRPGAVFHKVKKGDRPGKSAKFVYKVKKGDTLAKIARKYQTQVSLLLKLNHMKFRDNLYVDREITLPNQAQ